MQKIKEIFKKHWIISGILRSVIYIILALIFCYVVFMIVVFGSINYYGGQQNDKESARLESLILSNKGLPVPVTDVPVTLPPDPGEAGKATLEGIDSNHDGVRDDLEREIVYMYPQNEEVRRVLRAMMKNEQEFITTSSNNTTHNDVILGKLKLSYYAFWRCYNSLLLGLKDTDATKMRILLNMETNTSKRIKKENENDIKSELYISKFDSSISPNSESCTQVKGLY